MSREFNIEEVRNLDFSSKSRFRLILPKTPHPLILTTSFGADAATKRACDNCKEPYYIRDPHPPGGQKFNMMLTEYL